MSRKVSAFNLKTAADIDTAADYFPFIDASASDANKNSRTIFDELRKALGVGDLLSGNKITGTLVTQKKEYQALAGSATQTILDYSGSGYVNSLFVGISYSDVNSAYGNINIYLDGSRTPTISMPMTQFFHAHYVPGAATPNRYFNTRFFGANADGGTNVGYVTKLPIPFTSRVKIDIVNGSASAVTLWTVATMQTGVANTWSRTRKLCATTALIDAPSPNSTQTLVNILGKGRLVGIWMLQDDFPHSLSPVAAAWEGNFRFYIDNATKVWAASTAFSNGDAIIDGNGNLQTVTTPGTSGGSAPTWSQAAGGTTVDGGTLTWTQTPGTPNQVWLASKPFALNMAVVDTNGNVQRVTTAGTSGGSAPSWNVTVGGTTTDNSVTWTNQGSTYIQAGYQSSGTEDYFLQSLYGAGINAMSSGPGDFGTTFCNTTPLSSSSVTRSMYRYHVDDPITFDTSLVMTWQAGDTSQKAWSSGSPKIWVTVYFYAER